MSEDVASLKRRIRLESRAARAAITDLDRTRATDAVTHLVLGLDELTDCQVVAAYAAHDTELDPYAIVESLRFRGLTIALPRVDDPIGMSMHEVVSDAELCSGHRGILEPSPSCPVMELERIDALIVPGVAFGRDGTRIGYGGGYYDRLLPGIRGDAVIIGLAFDEQIHEELPKAEHDFDMDLVVTPSGVISRS